MSVVTLIKLVRNYYNKIFFALNIFFYNGFFKRLLRDTKYFWSS